jgi:hypothetical protein
MVAFLGGGGTNGALVVSWNNFKLQFVHAWLINVGWLSMLVPYLSKYMCSKIIYLSVDQTFQVLFVKRRL